MAPKSKPKSKKTKPSKKQSTSKSNQTKATLQSGGVESDPGYIRLRTITDSLEFGAIRYYLSASTPEEKAARLAKLEGQLMPIVDSLWNGTGEMSVMDIECPDGYVNCHGCCVPYPCPD